MNDLNRTLLKNSISSATKAITDYITLICFACIGPSGATNCSTNASCDTFIITTAAYKCQSEAKSRPYDRPTGRRLPGTSGLTCVGLTLLKICLIAI